MGLNRDSEALLEAYRSDYRVCLNSAFEELLAARLNGRGLSLPNTARVFSRHWHACLSDNTEDDNTAIFQIGCEQANKALRQWFEKPAA